MQVIESIGPLIVFHFLPSILGALLYLMLARIFIVIFRVKNPSVKFILHFMVLYKTLLVLINGSRYVENMGQKTSWAITFRLSDPLGMIPFSDFKGLSKASMSFNVFNSSYFNFMVLSVLIIIVLLVIFRWIATVYFYVNLKKEKTRTDTTVETIISEVSSKIGISAPDYRISEKNIGPLVIGFKEPTIILSRDVFDKLSDYEIKVVLAHEIAHIYRRDNYWQWLILMIKDLLFLNPLAQIVHKIAIVDKEISADNIAIQKTGIIKEDIESTVRQILDTKENAVKHDTLIAMSNFINIDITTKRIKYLKKFKIKKEGKIRMYLINSFCVFLFIWIKIVLPIKIGSKSLLYIS